MRKLNKTEWIQVIERLQEANDALQQSIWGEEAADCLAACQQCAILVGSAIEKESTPTQIVPHLEAYCEQLYQLSVAEDATARQEHFARIAELLSDVRREIAELLPDEKKQIVFLPYKASMWDSLESVWKAADADPQCDAWVIPIPYYDRSADGALVEYHYEGALFPEYVPVTRYEDYDLAAQHPDVIYIHNPYDEFNNVTSVHPAFYSRVIKDYTDQLIYIPYFVLREIEPDNQAAIDGMKHFCFLPGTIYADQVIVQSENMRQIYLNEYCKAAEAHFMPVDRAREEKRFLGLGSPKFDKVLHTAKEDVELPPEWLGIIQKPDGTWKKIILYNTSVAALLQNSELMLEKIQDVLRVFRENRQEVALLWRPHPLFAQTIAAMRPALRQQYEKIVQDYRTEGWGIYDDTADLNRAIALADAYYGDGSSVVQLCQKTGMPIMIQNVEVRS